MAHLNLRPGETADLASGTAIGAATRAPSPVAPAPRQSAVTPQAAPEKAERPISEILETLGFAFSAAGAGFQGKPIPTSPAAKRKAAQLQQQKLDLEKARFDQSAAAANFQEAQTFLKMAKDIPSDSKEAYAKLVQERFSQKDPDLANILGLALEDSSVAATLDNVGLPEGNAWLQSVVEQFDGDINATNKWLNTDTGRKRLFEEADSLFRPGIREKLFNLSNNLEQNFDAKTFAQIKKLSSPGGEKVTVGEIMSLLPKILDPENQFSDAEKTVLERNPDLLKEQGIIDDAEAAKAKAARDQKVFAANLKAAEDRKEKDEGALSARGKELADAGFEPGTEEFQSEMREGIRISRDKIPGIAPTGSITPTVGLRIRSDLSAALKPHTERLASVTQIRSTIETVTGNDNQKGSVIAERLVSNLFGSNQLKAVAELDRFVKAGSIVRRVANSLTLAINGKATESTLEDLKELVDVIEGLTIDSANTIRANFRKTLKASGVTESNTKDLIGEDAAASGSKVIETKVTKLMSAKDFRALSPTEQLAHYNTLTSEQKAEQLRLFKSKGK